ncbi:hypothetical protein HF851_01600 [Corynebacterium ammoniagenes]|uniref:SGNH/GDSL hydrolase family protein n=1 Tax=Corynebacterium ammoniagenes TaxID=1697 RepID=UPI0014594DCE|nr:SGNH/GDSL hydrolase family protein [Corynebacterium ammoniagenes]NMF30968.1 hypothetical protein [Corynebacterium ammoniagenes]
MHPVKKILGAVVATFASLTLTATHANAAPASNVVMFGDSFFANPTYAQVGGVQAMPGSSEIFYQGQPGAPSPQGCPQGQSNIGNELKTLGHNVVNMACSSAKAGGESQRSNMYSQVGHAIDTNALNASTGNVLIQFGANDAPSLMMDNPVTGASSDLILGEDYARGMRDNTNRIRQAAPNAKITVVSYPAVSAPNGALCPVRTDINNSGPGFNLDYLATVHNAEKFINSNMYQAARDNGVDFYDLNGATKYNNMCAKNSDRYIAGAIETGVPHNLSIHITHKGNTEIARLLDSSTM